MRRFPRFLARRLLAMVFQLFGALTIIFFLIRLIPGNPAQALAGPGASPETIKTIEISLGLDKPLLVQYGIYLRNLLRGDLGDSIFTGQPVTTDLLQRLPATLELVTTAMLIAIVLGIPLGIIVAIRSRGLLEKGLFLYGMLTGALPDFWLGLILVFVFFFILGWAPPPMGRLGLTVTAPERITGFLLLDSLIRGELGIFWLAAKQLALPVFTLVFIYMGNIVKMARSAMDEVLNSEFIEHAHATGLSRSTVIRYALRNAMPPVATVIAFTYGFLLGGAVLVETVFSWGGLGEYVVQSIVQSDYAPIQGFVLTAALFMSVMYVLLDIVYALLDPRITY